CFTSLRTHSFCVDCVLTLFFPASSSFIHSVKQNVFASCSKKQSPPCSVKPGNTFTAVDWSSNMKAVNLFLRGTLPR
ncbi:hypothetical protein DFJ73DRAFT_861100, partial [Zopfochytrium polystomum]